MRKFAFKISLTVILTITMGLVLGLASVALILLDVKRETAEFTEDVKVRGLSLSTAVSDVFAEPIASNDTEAVANAVPAVGHRCANADDGSKRPGCDNE
jgi:hypothetical protein